MTVATEAPSTRKTRAAKPQAALGIDDELRLTIAHDTLNQALHLVTRAVAARPSHPVLANVLLVAAVETQTVSLSAFDLSLGIQIELAAEVAIGGSVTLPAKLFAEMVSRLPDGSITLSLVKTLLALECSAGRYQIIGMGAEDFPELPEISEGETVELSVESLRNGLRGTLFAASSDETKQMLCGVRTVIERNGLEFAATDGHRLAVARSAPMDETAHASEGAVTIPAKALQELTKMMDRLNPEATVTLTFDQSQAAFTWAQHRLVSRLLEGDYPNYPNLMPRTFSRQVTVDRKHLLNSLERIAVLADQKNNIVKMALRESTQRLVLSVDAQDVGNGEESLPAQISGEDLELAFNIKYVMDGLRAIATSEVKMQANTATSPVIFSPLGGEHVKQLLMPVQVRGN